MRLLHRDVKFDFIEKTIVGGQEIGEYKYMDSFI